MANLQEKLAKALETLNKFQGKDSVAIIKTSQISRSERETLINNGFIKEVMKGWYISANPDEVEGDTTSWYASYWKFCKVYLRERFKDKWCISPEQSISIHIGNWTVPKQLIIRSPIAGNNVTTMIQDTTIVDAKLNMPKDEDMVEKDGIRIFSLPAALIACSPNFFSQSSVDVRTALSIFTDASDILSPLLEGGNSIIAGRLAGAFRNIGKERIADDIIKTMKAAGYDVRENDPFGNKLQLSFQNMTISPYVSRIKVMWSQMREVVIAHFPKAPGIPADKNSYLKLVEENYASDAYHSLSIEGFKVTTGLIERVRSGNWNPDKDEKDGQATDALAARGYYLAFQSVKNSIQKVFYGENAGQVVDKDHGDWYREMFTPSVAAGIINRAALAGYRNSQVFISKSKHIPLSSTGVRYAMPTLFEMLVSEKEASVRAVLGHFVFVFIHPYMDGNGRMGRFLMNVMLASGGYPWTVIPLEKRDDYINALEKASVDQNITDFAKFIADLVSSGISY
jgi:hypothetical protein